QNVTDTAPGGFQEAYYKLLPFEIFADPDMNAFVVREGGQGVYGSDAIWQMRKDEATFHKMAADLDHGIPPYDPSGPNGIQNAAAFLNQFKALTENHRKLQTAKMVQYPYIKADSGDAFSFETIVNRDARHCINGQ